MVKLFDFQKEALTKMKNGCILCGGVGSGKSLTALAYYIWKEKDKDLYIITTARKRDDKEWEIEFAKTKVKGVVDSWNNIGKYVDVENAFFIFDEQRVVGNGAWVKAFLKIVKRNDWILLSATPGDTWEDYIPVFIANGFYRNRTEFLARHAVMSRWTRYPRIEKFLDKARLERLRRKILVDMDYKKPAERHVVNVNVSYDRASYKRIMKSRFNEETNRPVQNASELCMLLRKCIGLDPSRIEAVRNLALLRRKVIIFYNYNYELEALRSLDLPGFEFAEWNGHKHEPIPDSESWVYLVQYSAGAEGWNCTETNSIIFYSLNYSYKITEQSMGRIDRVNTPFRDLYYYYILSKAPIDLSVMRALKNKKKFNERRWLGWG